MKNPMRNRTYPCTPDPEKMKVGEYVIMPSRSIYFRSANGGLRRLKDKEKIKELLDKHDAAAKTPEA